MDEIMEEEHDPYLVMLIKVIAKTCWRYDLIGLCHQHDLDLVETFHTLEEKGVLVKEHPDRDYVYQVTEPYKKYCWYLN